LALEWEKKTRAMNQEPNVEQLRELALQLSCPTGEVGKLTADQMHFSNSGMTRNTIIALAIAPHDKILELGHGNGKHISEILSINHTVTYYGLEISELMHHEADRYNQKERTSFTLYDGNNIPFKANYFSKIMTVNTLYFWKNPVHLLHEIYRVLKPGGKFSCTFAEKAFMEKLPFTKFIFELYDQEKIEKLIQSTPFKTAGFKEYTEQLTNKEGQSIERNYLIASLEK